MKEINRITSEYNANIRRIKSAKYIVLPTGTKIISYTDMLKEKQSKCCLVFRLVEEVKVRQSKKAVVIKESHEWNGLVVLTFKENNSGLVNCRIGLKKKTIHKKFLEFIVESNNNH